MHEFKKAKSQGTIRFRQTHENEFKKAKSSMGLGCRVTYEKFQYGLDIQQRVASAPVLTPASTPIKPGLHRKVDHVHNLDR